MIDCNKAPYNVANRHRRHPVGERNTPREILNLPRQILTDSNRYGRPYVRNR